MDAYDLILRSKAQLLSFNEPVRFLFSHSALREGWDNPNVFVIGMLKHSDSTMSRRQEVGRGLRISVNQNGERMDDPATVHDVNVLTVVASEGYKEFVAGLQTEIVSRAFRPAAQGGRSILHRQGLQTATGDIPVTPQMAKLLARYLISNDYMDAEDKITPAYHEAKKAETLAPLPAELAPYATQVFQLVDTVFSESAAAESRTAERPGIPLNANFHKKEFQELWQRIHQKAVYAVDFEQQGTDREVRDGTGPGTEGRSLAVRCSTGRADQRHHLRGASRGKSLSTSADADLRPEGSVHSAVPYDLIGKICRRDQADPCDRREQS